MTRTRAWVQLCGWIGIITLGGVTHAASPKGLILYFDPDGNHEAIKQTAKLFNDYLISRSSDLIFQPVNDREKFEMLLESEHVRYSIVSSDYLKRRKDARLRPILVPVRSNSNSYTKILIDMGEGAPGDLAGRKIAVAGAGAPTSDREILDMLRTNSLSVEGAQVVWVRDDVNAIRSVLWGRADAALVTQENIDFVLSIYVAKYRPELRRLFETPPIMRSPLCAIEPSGSRSHREIIELFEAMKRDPLGSKVMAQLRIDAWVPLPATKENSK